MASPKYLAELEKKYGSNVLIKFDGSTIYKPIETISTGSFRLDQALGNGGVPLGRMVELYGPQGGGKSSVMQSILANAQKKFPDKLVGLVEPEFTFDPARAQNVFGIDLTRLYLNQPSSGEEGWDVIEALLRSGEYSIIALDSIAALVPQKEAEADMDQQTIGLVARLTTKAMRKVGPLVAQSNTTLLIINQIRTNIQQWGTSEGRTGGHALDHHCSQIVRLGRTDFIKQGSEYVGVEIKAKVHKNKVATPQKEAEFSIYFHTGIDTHGELVAIGEEYGILKRAGGWYKYNGETVGQGAEATARWLKDHPEVQEEISKSVSSNS